MCSEESTALLRRIAESVERQGYQDITATISGAKPLIVDYRERRFLYLRSSVAFILTLENVGSLPVPPNTWVNVGFDQGARLTPSTSVTVLIRATDDYIYSDRGVPSVATSLTAYSGNPTQTATAGADTLYKFGANGNTTFSHCVIQNNTGISINYSFDADSTVSTNMVYVLPTTQIVFWDRAATVLHFSSASQQSFGGSSGIAVEAFL